MKTSDLFPSKFLKAEDLTDGPQTVVIRELTFEEVGQGKDRETKPVLHFSDSQKPMVLNKTNCLEIEVLYGDTANWPGKPVELYSARVQFGNKMVDAVRVRAPQAPNAKDLLDEEPVGPKGGGKTTAETAPLADPELEDVIPF
jgi:hypothetical protein